MRTIRRVALVAACLALAACGGGGDSGSGGTSGAVLTVTGPGRVDADVYERQTVPSVVISGRLSGDLSSLSGKTLYLIVVLPDTFLFAATPLAHIDSDGLGGNVQLLGAVPPDGVHTYTGTMTLHACLDPACASELTVANASVPYSIRVKTGLKAATSSVTLDTTFGTPVTPVVVPVTLPDDVVSWVVRPGNGSSTFGIVHADKAADGSSNVVFSASELTLPNNPYTDRVFIEAVTAGAQTLTATVSVTLTTGPSSIPFAFQRPSAAFALKQGNANLTNSLMAGALFPDSSADRFRHVTTSYAWPAAADASSPRDRWLRASFSSEAPPRRPGLQYLVDLQAAGCISGQCLPEGRYTATVHYVYAPATGAPTNVDYVVTLDVAPRAGPQRKLSTAAASRSMSLASL